MNIIAHSLSQWHPSVSDPCLRLDLFSTNVSVPGLFPRWNVSVLLFYLSSSPSFCPFTFVFENFFSANLDSSRVPRELRSDLDGPKWAPSGARRSNSRAPLALPPAPRKPRAQFVRGTSVPSATRRLYEETPTSRESCRSGDADSCDDDAPTPRPAAHASDRVAGDRSFVQDLVPRAPPFSLLQDLQTLGQAAADIAGGIAQRVSQRLPGPDSTGLLVDYAAGTPTAPSGAASSSGRESPAASACDPSPSERSASVSTTRDDPIQPDSPTPSSHSSDSPDPGPPPSGPPPPGPLPPPIVNMPTSLPDPDRIGNLKEVKEFNGSPADLSLFDTQIRNALRRKDIPAYNGGCVTGDVADGYDFVPAVTAGCKSNYRLGINLCSAVSNRLTGAAATWWDDYDCSDKPVPNCWKKASDANFVPPDVVEVSLYDLLVQQFDPTVDAQQAELELASYRWNPLEKNALGVIPFRGHVSRLCTRAGKTGWAMKGIAIRNTFPDWLRSRVMVSKSEDTFWDEVSACVNTEMADRLRDRRDDRKDAGSRDGAHGARDKQSNGRDKHDRQDRHDRDKQDNSRGRRDKSKKCLFCGFSGHEVSECRRMKAAAVIQQQELQSRDQNRDQGRDQNQDRKASGTSSASARPPVVCYNCNKPGHISPNCPEPKRQNATAAYVGTEPSPMFLSIPAAERFDDLSSIRDSSGRPIDLPLYQILSQPRERREVFSLPPLEDLSVPSGIFHSFTQSKGGQDMLTVWDTGALLSLVPMSTVTALNLPFSPTSDVAFVVANSSRMEPLGYCPNMPFSICGHGFVDKVYVVESAPFQLLLGIQFLHRHWAGMFVPWGLVVLCRPHRIEVQCSFHKPQRWQRLSPEEMDDLDGISRRVVEYDDDPSRPPSPRVEVPMLLSMPLEVGRQNLVHEVDSPIASDFTSTPNALITREFVRETVHFGPTCPAAVIEAAVDLILEHWTEFSWHEMDLGCIQDVPYDTSYVDLSPCSCKSRRHNSAPAMLS